MRRTAATIIADRGHDTDTLKRYVGWKSTKVAESYVAASKSNQKKMANSLAPVVSPYFTRTKSNADRDIMAKASKPHNNMEAISTLDAKPKDKVKDFAASSTTEPLISRPKKENNRH